MKLLALALSLMMLLISLGWAADPSPLPDDPTRPPTGLVDADGNPLAPASGLTSVVLPKKGKPAAVIDGQLVPLGGSVRDAKLVRVAETHVVLEGPQGRERIYLTPDIEKMVIAPKAAPRRQKE